LAAGCSGARASATAQARSCRAPGVTATDVKAGLLFSNTGPGASADRAFRAGVDARLGVANTAGGVDGRKIVYAWRDDATDPTVNLTSARELVGNEKIFGLMEGPNVASGSARYLAGQGVPVVGLAGEPAWAQHDNMFSWHYYEAASGSSSVWGAFVRDQGGTRAALVDVALSGSALDFHRQLVDSLQKAGVEDDLNFQVTNATTDFAAMAQQMKAAGIDTITGGFFPDTLAKLLPALRAAGVTPKVVLTPLGYDPTLLQQLGPTLAGTIVYIDFVPFELNTAAQARMRAAMADYAPQIQPPTQESAVYGWLSADMFLRGLQAAGPCPTRESFITGLRAIHDYTAGGLLPQPVNFTTNRGKLTNCYDFVQVSPTGTRFTPLTPPLRCGTPIP
jgi:branched-chain amino acid transport system substrate-binding protein